MAILRGKGGRSQRILKIRRTGWNKEKEKQRSEVEEMPSSHR